jgi:hypothetical protein
LPGLYKLDFLPRPWRSARYTKIKSTLIIYVKFSHSVCITSRGTLSVRWPEPQGSKSSSKVPTVVAAVSNYTDVVAASSYTGEAASNYTDAVRDTVPAYANIVAGSTYTNAAVAGSSYTYTAVTASN